MSDGELINIWNTQKFASETITRRNFYSCWMNRNTLSNVPTTIHIPRQSQDLNLVRFKRGIPSTAPSQVMSMPMLCLTVLVLCLLGDAKVGTSQRLSHEFSHAENKCLMPEWNESPRFILVSRRSGLGTGWQSPWERETSDPHYITFIPPDI